MHSNPTTVRIESIIFDNMDTKVLIKGETFKNHLSYASELFVNFSELNMLLNALQQLNPEKQIGELFQEEYLGGGYTQTSMQLSSLENALIDLNFLNVGGRKMLIRA